MRLQFDYNSCGVGKSRSNAAVEGSFGEKGNNTEVIHTLFCDILVIIITEEAT